MVGINETGNASLDIINEIGNSTSLEEMYILIDQNIYGGMFWFMMLWVLFFILYTVAQQAKDQPLNNAMYSLAVCAVFSFLLRAVTITIDGFLVGMLSDYQMWVFPLLTALLGAIIWAIKDR